MYFFFLSAATLKSIDDLGEGMVRDGTKCGNDKVPCTNIKPIMKTTTQFSNCVIFDLSTNLAVYALRLRHWAVRVICARCCRSFRQVNSYVFVHDDVLLTDGYSVSRILSRF